MAYILLVVAASVLQLIAGVALGMRFRRNRLDAAALLPAPPAEPGEPSTSSALSLGALSQRGERRESGKQGSVKTSPPSGSPSAVAKTKLPPGRPGAAKQFPLEPADELACPSSGVMPEPEVRGSDRRVAVRRRFTHKQYVAPYRGGCLPSPSSFREVVCQDVSATGFSFLSPQPPDFDSLVVALGVAPDMTYMTARVVNRIQISDVPAPLYRIGCRFSGRIN